MSTGSYYSVLWDMAGKDKASNLFQNIDVTIFYLFYSCCRAPESSDLFPIGFVPLSEPRKEWFEVRDLSERADFNVH